MVHSENVDEVLANRVGDAVGKAMGAGAKEGGAGTLAAKLVPRESLVDVELGAAPNSNQEHHRRPPPGWAQRSRRRWLWR